MTHQVEDQDQLPSLFGSSDIILVNTQSNGQENLLNFDRSLGSNMVYDPSELNISSSYTEDLMLKETLAEIVGGGPGHVFLYDLCQNHGVTYDSLKYLERDNIADLVPNTHLGLRSKFQSEISKWKIRNNVACDCSCGTFQKSNEENQNIVIFSSTSEGTKIPRNNNFILSDIINEVYQEIKKKYSVNNLLLEADRRNLATTIVNFFTENKIHLTSTIMSKLAIQITTEFPGESQSAWYHSEKGKRAGGRLHFKLYNENRKHLQGDTDLEPAAPMFTKKPEANPNDVEKDGELKKSWLKYNKDSIDEILNKWKDTLKLRRVFFESHKDDQSVFKIIEEWPSYKLPLGYLLVDIDFNYLYPEVNDMFYKNWEKFIKSVLTVYIGQIKRGPDLRTLQKLQKNDKVTEDGKHAAYLHLLHNIVQPSMDKKTKKKYSCKDAQESVIRIISSTSELDSFTSIRTQPFVFCVGSTFWDIKEIYVFFDNIKYKVPNILQAFCTCFKIFHIFNLKYPEQSINFWTFIQNYFFEIYLSCDKRCTASKTLIETLKQHVLK